MTRYHHDSEECARSRMTVATWLGVWLDDVAIAHPRTLHAYTRWSRHIIEEVGDVPLADLDSVVIRRLLARRLASGLSRTSVRHIYAVLRVACSAAVAAGELRDNPVASVRRPAVDHYEASTLTQEEARRLIAECLNDRLGALIVLAIQTGMRLGELLALTWRDVDLETGVVSVTKSLVELRGGGVLIGATKTKAGRRTVVIAPPVCAVLRAHKQRQDAEAATWPIRWNSKALVFCSTSGDCLQTNNLRRRYYYPLLDRAGVPHIRFHDLRHTAALLMLRVSNIVAVSRQLGHSSTVITATFYGHADRVDSRHIAAGMGNLMDITQAPRKGASIPPASPERLIG